MKRSLSLIAVVGLLFTSSAVVAVPAHDPEPYGYHLRIVRVSGAIGNPGAAVGWTENGGIPVMLPSEEAWGDPGQLQALARTLGGERADAIAGFFLTADASGAKFDRRVYVEDSVIDLSFDALPPGPGSDEHQLSVQLDAPESEHPLDTTLGTLFGALDRSGLVSIKARRAANARRAQLEARHSAESDAQVAAFQSGFEDLVEDVAGSEAPGKPHDNSVPPAVASSATLSGGGLSVRA